MAVAIVWDAYRRNQYEGVVVKRYEAGISIDLSNGVRVYATNDRIVSVTGEILNISTPNDEAEEQ
jgi:hypothetical protein